jgi:hypothetical protein
MNRREIEAMSQLLRAILRIATKSCLIIAGPLPVVTAAAADLTPGYQAQSNEPGPYNWNGHIGAAWDHRDGRHFNTLTGAPTGTSSTDASGITGGGMIMPDWLIGNEADIICTTVRSQRVTAKRLGGAR